MLAGASDAAVDLLGRDAGEQGLALGLELGRDLQFVAAHQAPGGVQDWQLAMATALQLCPLQLQRRAGLTLMDGALAIR